MDALTHAERYGELVREEDTRDRAESSAAAMEQRIRDAKDRYVAEALAGKGDFWRGDYDDEIREAVLAALSAPSLNPDTAERAARWCMVRDRIIKRIEEHAQAWAEDEER